MMVTKKKVNEEIVNELESQGVSYEHLTKNELNEVDKKWKDKFIGKLTAPHLENYRWHIFSYHEKTRVEGQKATNEYKTQYPSEVFIFNEKLQFGIRCLKSSNLPHIEMSDFRDDIYICHHNMKWTYVITHESPDYGPYFSLG